LLRKALVFYDADLIPFCKAAKIPLALPANADSPWIVKPKGHIENDGWLYPGN
jgi:hypothetical protein